MIHLPAFAWPGEAGDNTDWTNFSPNDKVRLQHWGGGIPVLGFSFGPWGNYAQASWNWLSAHGYRNAVVRLYAPAELPEPEAFIDCHQDGLERPVKAKFDIIGQIDNEPELEHSLSPQDYAVWALKAVRRWKERYPAWKVCSPPLSHNSPRNLEYLNCLQSIGVLDECDYLGVHYYWGMQAGDTAPGLPFTPEWFHERFPTRELIVGECGNWNEAHSVATVLNRWTQLSYIHSYHVFVMSASSQEHAPRFYNDDLSNELYNLARTWRDTRSYPRGAVEVATPADGGALAEKYPTLFDEWCRAGGIANNFRKHVLGMGIEPVTLDDVRFLAQEGLASARQIDGAVNVYHP